jgi:hypothetical protein
MSLRIRMRMGILIGLSILMLINIKSNDFHILQ